VGPVGRGGSWNRRWKEWRGRGVTAEGRCCVEWGVSVEEMCGEKGGEGGATVERMCISDEELW